MAEPFIGQLMPVGFNFAPRGWATCDGQLMSIAQNTALFSLLGTFYGGNGTTTFALPDLRGRVAIHQGQGPGLSPYVIGEVTGTENTSILQSNLPAHSHSLNVDTGDNGSTTHPSGQFLASTGGPNIYAGGPADSTMSVHAIGLTGNGIPINILQPLLVVNWCIALVGIFPSRN